MLTKSQMNAEQSLSKLSHIKFLDSSPSSLEETARQIILDDWLQGLLKDAKGNCGKNKLNADFRSDWLFESYQTGRCDGVYIKDTNGYRFRFYANKNRLYCMEISKDLGNGTSKILISSNLPLKCHYTAEFLNSLMDTDYLDSVLAFIDELKMTRLQIAKKIEIMLAVIRASIPTDWTVKKDPSQTLNTISLTFSKADNPTEVYFEVDVDIQSVIVSDLSALVKKQISAIATVLNTVKEQIPGCCITSLRTYTRD